MKKSIRVFASFAMLLGIVTVAHAQSRIVITEIMYDPASNEQKCETEWVEIANVGSEPIEIKDWYLDDEDRGSWGKFSCKLAPGEIAVLINSLVTEADFRAAWDIPSDAGASTPKHIYQALPVKWGALGNKPTAEDETLALRNEKDEVVCEVNIQSGGDWPECGKTGSSIWLSDLKATAFHDGKLWRKSESGIDGARMSRKSEQFGSNDCGSPGFVHGITDGTGSASAPSPAAPVEVPAAEEKPKNTVDY